MKQYIFVALTFLLLIPSAKLRASDNAGVDRARQELARLRLAVADLERSFPDGYQGVEFRRQLDDCEKTLDAGTATARLADLERYRRQMLVDANPLLKGKRLLFVKRNAYGSFHYYDDHDNGIVQAGMGGNLCELTLQDGSVRELAPQLAGGLFDRFDLSFDGREIVFGYCKALNDALRLWRINVDGSGLRQVTFPLPSDAPAVRAALGPNPRNSADPMAKDAYGNLVSRWFLTQDFHPCWLPDGGIAFTSTRTQHTVLCGGLGLSAPNLYRIQPDGSGLRRLSYGALNELCPTVLNDGRILYNRWEYVFKTLWYVQPLWAMLPDGSHSEEIYGLNVGAPGAFMQGRAVPGRNNLIVCVGACHEQMAVGPILLVNLQRDKRSASAMQSITPEVESRGTHDRWFLRDGKMVQDTGSGGPVFCDPWPLSDKFFLVAHNADKPIADKAAYGLYLLDVFGNRVPIYRDPTISCWQPMTLEPRPRPPVLSTTIADASADTQSGRAEGTLFLQDVYQGLNGVRPGSVKYLRVVEQVPRSWDVLQKTAPDDGGGGSPMVVLNGNTHLWVAALHGIVPVCEDGSACFTVPANRNIFFQALDKDFMQIQTMRTFVNLQPGENRSCVGCHEDRRSAPMRQGPFEALRRPPVRLAAQPGDATASKPLHYVSDVQPVLDQHCVRCHGNASPGGKLDLSGTLTTFFNRSYEELLAKGHVQGFSEWSNDPKDSAPLAPYSRGSHTSKLIRLLRDGHYDVKLSQPEMVRLVTWVDLNLPYYGTYYGRRNLRYQGEPDFRPVPQLSSVYDMPTDHPRLDPQNSRTVLPTNNASSK